VTRPTGTLRPVAARDYGQYCAIAKALDVLGDRWALLIVRELLFGPHRYSGLQARLPGIATDMLATRLRELEQRGVVGRADDGRAYALTERGLALRPVLEALSVWGLAELGDRPGDQPYDPLWMTIPLRGLVRPARAADTRLTVRFVVGADEILLRIDDGDVSTPSAADEVDVTVSGTPDELAAAVTRPGSPPARRVGVTGEPQDVAALLYVVGLSDEPPASARRPGTK
jgi:DNA-binding HxlR family transcriptional regulator